MIAFLNIELCAMLPNLRNNVNVAVTNIQVKEIICPDVRGVLGSSHILLTLLLIAPF